MSSIGAERKEDSDVCRTMNESADQLPLRSLHLGNTFNGFQMGEITETFAACGKFLFLEAFFDKDQVEDIPRVPEAQFRTSHYPERGIEVQETDMHVPTELQEARGSTEVSEEVKEEQENKSCKPLNIKRAVVKIRPFSGIRRLIKHFENRKQNRTKKSSSSSISTLPASEASLESTQEVSKLQVASPRKHSLPVGSDSYVTENSSQSTRNLSAKQSDKTIINQKDFSGRDLETASSSSGNNRKFIRALGRDEAEEIGYDSLRVRRRRKTKLMSALDPLETPEAILQLGAFIDHIYRGKSLLLDFVSDDESGDGSLEYESETSSVSMSAFFDDSVIGVSVTKGYHSAFSSLIGSESESFDADESTLLDDQDSSVGTELDTINESIESYKDSQTRSLASRESRLRSARKFRRAEKSRFNPSICENSTGTDSSSTITGNSSRKSVTFAASPVSLTRAGEQSR